MFERIKSAVLTLIGLLILAVFIGILGYVMLNFFGIVAAVIAGAKTLEPTVYVPLSITLLTAVLGLAVTLYTQARTRRREIESAFRERKIEIYLEFLEKLETLFLAQKSELELEPVSEKELTISLVKVRTKAVLWGSTGVLRSLNDFTKMDAKQPLSMFEVMDRIQREMRKDLGLSNRGLEKQFFTKLILSDPGELDKLNHT